MNKSEEDIIWRLTVFGRLEFEILEKRQKHAGEGL